MPNEKEILNTLRDIATALTAIQHTLQSYAKICRGIESGFTGTRVMKLPLSVPQSMTKRHFSAKAPLAQDKDLTLSAIF